MPAVPKPVYKKKEKVVTEVKKVSHKELVPLEELEQETVADWLDIHKIMFTATMAGSYLHPATFNRMKRMGLKRGVSDLIIFDPPLAYYDGENITFFGDIRQIGIRFNGVCLEMKRRKGGVLSDEQLTWMKQMETRGWLCHVAYGAEDAIDFLERCGYGKTQRG
jgi:hypothetical protein